MKNIFIAILMSLSTHAYALVDMQNANFTETWVDLEIPDTGYNLKIERAYNSRTLHNGLFGFGWCSNFETSLEILADGRIKRVECGAGQEITYAPKSFDPAEVQEGLSKIISAMKKENPALSGREIQIITQKLKEDTLYRDRESARLNVLKEVKEGTIFFGEGANTDKIVLKKGFYIRDLSDGSSERFDTSGQLVYLYDKNQNYLKLDYNKKTLAAVTTSSGRRLSFEYTPNGKIKEIRGPGGLTTEYKYEKLNDLISAKNGKDETTRYEYDTLHNITKVTYADKSYKSLKYNQDKDWVTELIDRNGCIEKYDYVLSKEDPKNNFWSTVEKKCDGKIVNKSKYGFWFKPRSNNSGVYLSKLSIDNNGAKSEIEYHNVFEKPLTIKKDKELTQYAYYPNGLLKTKRVNNQVINFKYNNLNKVSEVSEGKGSTKFTYDKIGNLTYAANSNGQSVKLEYDHKGRIVKIFDQAKRLINIDYDERFGKPKMVERPGVGKIFVSYNNEGVITKVESKNNDPTVTVQVASAFNNLIDIITPAGVNIGL
jgi:YD repeat-containing protein